MGTILIVDEQESICDMLRRIFGSRFDYRSASTVLAATTLLETLQFDAVVTDIALPNQVGVETAEVVRQLQPGSPLIIVSEIRDVDRARTMLRNGAFGHIIKPIKTRELQQTVELAVDSHRLPKQIGQLIGLDQSTGVPRAVRFEVIVEVRLSSVLLFEHDGQNEHAGDLLMIEGHTRDISESGLGIIAPAGSLDEQSVIGLTFHVVLGLSTGWLDIEAMAVRCERLDEGYLIGAQITNMSGKDKMLYLKYLFALSRV